MAGPVAPIIAKGISGGLGGSTAGGGMAKVASVAQVVGGAAGMLGEGLSPISSIVSIVQARKNRKQAARQFDLQFNENKRRWGLQFALREWSVRTGMTMQQAQMRYEQEMGRAGMAITERGAASALKTEAIGQEQAEMGMRWAREDRAKAARVSKAYNRGVMGGILGGGGKWATKT